MDDALDYLRSLEHFGMKLGLERMQRLMEVLNHPERKFKSIHVAGTNGKGSTVAMISSALREAGWLVGQYTSPHLFSVNERIVCDGKHISDENLAKLVRRVRDALTGVQPTYFEFLTAVAFVYFAEKNVDVAVVEVGLGGRLDATNVLQPEIAVITDVSVDHTKNLGTTVKKIAREKAGIIKHGCTVVTVEQDETVLECLTTACRTNTCDFHVVVAPTLVRTTPLFQEFVLHDTPYRIPLLGEHQARNAALAIHVLGLLKIGRQHVKRGLERTEWPARFQIVSENPLIIIDGAHNVAGMEALVKTIERFPVKTLVLAIAKNKQLVAMVQRIAPLFETVIVTKGSFKPEDPNVIAAEVKKYVDDVSVFANVEEAVDVARQNNNGVLITGSLYMIPDALRALKKVPIATR